MKHTIWTLILLFNLLRTAEAGNHATILQYHHFGTDTPPITSVTPDTFRQHVDYLQRNGFEIWPLHKIVIHLKKQMPLPEKCVAITIDDAYISIYENAFPILKEKNWPFTVFVATEAVDKGYKGILTWDQMRKMAAYGADFAGHTHTHLHMLKRLENEPEAKWEARIREEIRMSISRIKAEIGRTVPLFAYPYGEYNSQILEIVDSMGLVGFGQQSGPAWTGSDFRALPRFAMAADYAQMDSFTIKINALPLPVKEAVPADPVLEENLKPVLQLTLEDGEYSKESLRCFLSGHGPVELRWIDLDKGIVEAVSNKALPEGRSRYNFTARHKNGARYFWYSHLWIRRSH